MKSFLCLVLNETEENADRQKYMEANRLIQNSMVYSFASSSLKQPGDGFGIHTSCRGAINIFHSVIHSPRLREGPLHGLQKPKFFWVAREWRVVHHGSGAWWVWNSTKSLSVVESSSPARFPHCAALQSYLHHPRVVILNAMKFSVWLGADRKPQICRRTLMSFDISFEPGCDVSQWISSRSIFVSAWDIQRKCVFKQADRWENTPVYLHFEFCLCSCALTTKVYNTQKKKEKKKYDDIPFNLEWQYMI